MRPHNMILCALLCVFLTACAAAPAQEPPVSEASVQTAALPVPPEKTAAPAVSVVSKMRLPDAPVRRIVGNEYTAEVTEAEAAHEGYTLLSRRYAFSDGCTVEMHRADGMTDSVLFFSDLLPNIGEISFFDEAHNEWRHLPLQEGSWQTQIVMLRTDGGRNYFIYTPRTFHAA